jgi:alanyl-tRNA synthetase
VLRDIAFHLKGEMDSAFVFVAGSDEGDHCTLMLMLSDDLVARGLNAGRLVKDAAVHIQGGGGGQPHFATAGGRLSSGLPAAIDSILHRL